MLILGVKVLISGCLYYLRDVKLVQLPSSLSNTCVKGELVKRKRRKRIGLMKRWQKVCAQDKECSVERAKRQTARSTLGETNMSNIREIYMYECFACMVSVLAMFRLYA